MCKDGDGNPFFFIKKNVIIGLKEASMEYSPNKMKTILDNQNFHFKKKYGQNFIVDKNVILNIVSKANIDKNTLVLEIGPGVGSLTNLLGEHAKNVLAYEIDESVKPILETNIHNNTDIIYDDFLKRDIKKDLIKYTFKKLYVVANLPYYITTPIIVKLIEDKLPIDKIVVMVQKEVGDRFKAKPNTKEYNSLSIFLNYYFEIKKLFDVSKNVFMPKPKVDSIVIELVKKEKKLPLKNEDVFFKLIRDSFRQKRKTLRNNLKAYDLNKIEEILKKYNFDLSVRAEAIPLQVFVEIANNL